MNQTRYALWNIFYSLFFITLVAYGLQYLYVTDRLTYGISLGDFLLIALAIFRLVRLVSYDLIFSAFREWLKRYPTDTFFGTLSQLVHCPWCSGLWFSFAVIFAFYFSPVAWYVILILALAGVASLFQIISNLVGWSAEYTKRRTIPLTGETAETTISKTGSTCG